MTDDRPLPEYGEYATPEQQAAAMGKVYVPPAPEPVAADTAAVLPAVGFRRSPGYGNRFLTVFLLGLGALTLLGNAPVYFSYASSVKGAFTAAGMTSISVPTSLDGAGIPTLIANILIYLATVTWAVVVLRRGRTSFWIPIVGWLVFVIVSALFISIWAPGYLTQFSH